MYDKYTFVGCRIFAVILDAVRHSPLLRCLEQQRWYQPSVAGSLLRYGFAEVLIGCPTDVHWRPSKYLRPAIPELPRPNALWPTQDRIRQQKSPTTLAPVELRRYQKLRL